MKYVNRSQSNPDAFVGALNDNDENTNTVVTVLVDLTVTEDDLPTPLACEIGSEVYDQFRKERATPNQISSAKDSHRYSVLDANGRLAGTLYISRPQDPDRDLYCVMYPGRGADTVENLSRVDALRAKLGKKPPKDPNDPMPF